MTKKKKEVLQKLVCDLKTKIERLRLACEKRNKKIDKLRAVLENALRELSRECRILSSVEELLKGAKLKLKYCRCECKECKSGSHCCASCSARASILADPRPSSYFDGHQAHF